MKYILVSLICLLVLGCEPDKKTSSKLSDFIPADANLVVQITNLENFKNDIRSNELISEILASDEFNLLNEAINNLQTKDTVLIGLGQSTEQLSLSLVTRLKDSLMGDKPLEAINMPFKVADSIFVAHNSQTVLDSLKPSPHRGYDQMISTSGSTSSFTLWLPQKSTSAFSSAILQDSQNFAEQTVIESVVSSDQILISGISKTNDSIPQLAGAFSGSVAQVNTIQNVVPSNAEGFLSFSYSDFQNLYDKLQSYNDSIPNTDFNPELFQTLSEVAEIYLDDVQVLALKSIDSRATKEALRNHLNVVSTHRNVDIIGFEEPNIFLEAFSPLVKTNNLSRYIQLDDYFIFSDTEEALHNVIANFQNGTTYANSSAFKSCMEQLSDASSILVFTKTDGLKDLISSWLGNRLSLPLRNYELSAFQWVQDEGFAHLNGVIKKHKAPTIRNTITEEFSVTLDADIITPPQFVVNHRTKHRDILVQDVNNTVYLISNSGKILWKKKIIGAILGKVEQVDLYRNGRLQLAFATPYRVYVIDRNGNHVGAFPMKFGEEITQPLSVFDYDNNRNYRFLVTQGKDLLMYDRSARFVKGFRYENPNIIKTQPRHFRVGSKDYIVFAAGRRMMILNRRGAVRVGVRDRFDFSGEDIYLYKNTFTTTDENGALIQVDQNGKATVTNIGLEKEHQIFATAKTLVTLSENKLGIKQETIELDYGEYTEPVIHYINDKIYVTLTDRQAQKVYTFDSRARAIENFPVYGNSTMDLDNADADNSLEFVTQAETNSLVMYKKN